MVLTASAGEGEAAAALAAQCAEGSTQSPALPTDRDGRGVPEGVRWVLWAASALVVALLISLIVRSTGSSYTPVDGWGVAALELSMGVLCVARYYERSWRSSASNARLVPL